MTARMEKPAMLPSNIHDLNIDMARYAGLLLPEEQQTIIKELYSKTESQYSKRSLGVSAVGGKLGAKWPTMHAGRTAQSSVGTISVTKDRMRWPDLTLLSEGVTGLNGLVKPTLDIAQSFTVGENQITRHYRMNNLGYFSVLELDNPEGGGGITTEISMDEARISVESLLDHLSL